MKEEHKAEETQNDFFVVGIGASAGGLDAIQELFDNLPVDTGMAFVIVQHLSTNFKSLMDELLAKHTKMPIHLATEDVALKPNNIYLNPNNSNITCKNGKIVYQEKDKSSALNLPIDIFFHSLGNDAEHRSIGVILSGTGTDGSRGIATIKEAGGTILVQEPGSAQFDGMPLTAINSNLADYILTPRKIGEELARIADRPKFFLKTEENDEISTETNFTQILDIIYKNSGIDFRQYKPATLIRRIEKRMTIRQLTNLKDYLEYLKSNPNEKDLLFNDFLIGVTTFFRDPQAFSEIKSKVFPEIFIPEKQKESVRFWVVACSTGEEAYSLAILIDEYLKENKLNFDFKIFATDADSKAIHFAGLGRYPVNLVSDIAADRLEKYFIKTGIQLEVVKSIREKIVFSNHNILRDPPFIRMDFISCRNLLIYMKTKVQRKITLALQFGLKLNGFLFLGNSENLGEVQNKFQIIDSKWRLYKNISDVKTLPSQLQNDNKITSYNLSHPFYKESVYGIPHKFLPETVFNRHIAEELAPTCIYLDKDYNVLFINGNVNDFLKIGRGLLQQDLFKMLVNDKLAAMIRNGIRRLKEEKKTIYFNGFSFQNNGINVFVNLQFSMVKLESFPETLVLVVFNKLNETSDDGVIYNQYKLDEFSKHRLDDLENELRIAKQETQNVIEELETSNEELQASNEELQASNEELQSTNEELQSVNEELYTVNSELQAKNRELNDLTNDFSNLFNSTNIAMLFLDVNLRIRKFTPELKKIFRLEDNDINRPIENFASNFINVTGKDLAKDASQVIKTMQVHTRELKDEDGTIYLKRINPFMVNNHKAEGAIITFIDITEITIAQKAVEESTAKLRSLFNTMVEGFALHEIICDTEGKPVDYVFLDVNAAFELQTQLKREDIVGKKVTEVLPGIEKEEFNWIERYGKVALTGSTDYFENQSLALNKWYSVKVFCPEHGKFAVLFSDISERKKIEATIQASEEKFRNLFETMTQGVVYQNSNGEIISANSAAERILGMSFDQMTGRTSMDSRWRAIKEDGSDFPGEVHPAMMSLKTGKEINNVIMGVYHPHNEAYHWLNVNSKPLFRKDEKVPYQVYSTFEDITFQKNAMLTISQHKLNLELAQSIANMGSWEVNLKTGDWNWSELFYTICGLKPFSVQPSLDTFCSIIHPDDHDKSRDELQKALLKKEGYSLTQRIVLPDGNIKTVLSKGEFLNDMHGNPDKFIGIFIDISNQIRKDAEINKLFKAFLQSPTPNVLTDKNGVIEFVNNSLCDLTGYNPQELIGRKTNIFKSGKHPDDFYKTLWTDILDKKIWQGELINKKKNGQIYWEYATISPIFDHTGNLVNYIKVAQDITEQVELKAKLELAKQKAEEADKLKSSFLANMSHEIRTPMNSIIGFAQILNEPDLTAEKRKKYIDIINSQGEHLLTLINDIIDISKIETNGITLREETCNVNNLVFELQTFFAQNRRNSIDIQVHVSKNITNPVISVDATRLRQVLTNLIGNAVKFTTNGYVDFGYSLKHNYLEFFVKDTGIGIPTDKKEKIFDRFYQVENSNKELLSRGTGLGLAISKALVNLMGGNIWLESEEFVGSTFFFTIPYLPAQIVEKTENINPTGYKDIFLGKTVLIAEDIESNFMFLNYALNVTGIKILWCKNGREVIEAFKNNPAIDLILMDINMPILDGYEATRKIKQINQKIPIIAQTAYAMESDKEKVLEAGCDDYLSKPIKIGNLVDMINKYIGKSSSTSN